MVFVRDSWPSIWAFACSLCILQPNFLTANPRGCEVKAGHAVVTSSDPQTLTIQTSDRSILHWQQFSIAQGETTRFVMPNAASAVLNRVMGNNLSEIYGALESNGQLFLINPKGIMIGAQAQINTASFFASTLDALDADFLRGAEITLTGNGQGSIIHLGTISAWDGDIALIAYHIDNQGLLNAPKGVAALAAGTSVLLSPQGNERILIRASQLEAESESIGIKNSGTIDALRVELKADGHPYQFAIKDSAHIDASTIQQRGGEIYLVAENGRVDATGHYLAGSQQETGGTVHLLAQEVYVDGPAHIDVSGAQGGGTILVGGDYQGKNSHIPNAHVTFVGSEVTLTADAKIEGDGGKVILWGNHATGFFGSISAQGGLQGGNGGFIEVSSPHFLDFHGTPDTRAPCGKVGTLLLDPCTVTIDTNPTTGGGTCANGWDFGASTLANILNTDLQNCLNSNNVLINASGSGSAAFGSITVNAPISWNTANTLTLQANDSPSSFIQINDFISYTDTTMDTSLARITLTGGNVLIGDVAQTHAIDCGIQTSRGAITINANHLELYGGTTGTSQLITPDGSGGFYGGLNLTLAGHLIMLGGSGVGSNAELQGSWLGLTANQDVQLTGGSVGQASITLPNIQSNTSISCNGLSLTGNQADAFISFSNTYAAASYPISINTGNSALTLQGGSGGMAQILFYPNPTSPFVALSITSSGLYLNGGTGTGGFAEIINQGGPIVINSTAATPGPIELIGGSADNTYAQIMTTTVSYNTNTTLITIGNTTPPTGVLLTGGNGNQVSRAIIATDLGGDISCTLNGNYTLTGGTSNGASTDDGRAGLYTGLTSSSGNISLTGNGYLLAGGASGIGQNEAEIATVHSSGVIHLLSQSGDIWLKGGGGDLSAARIFANQEGSTFSTIQTVGDIKLDGGSGDQSPAEVVAITTSGSFAFNAVTTQGDFIINGGTGNTNSRAGFYLNGTNTHDVGGGLNLTGHDFLLTGGASGTGTNRAEIYRSGNNHDNISIDASGNISLQGGAAPISSARIFSDVTGNATSGISIQGQGNLSLIGGPGNEAGALILCDQYPFAILSISITGDYLIQGGLGANAQSGIYNGVTSNGNNIFLTGNKFTLDGNPGAAEIKLRGNNTGSSLQITAHSDITLQGFDTYAQISNLNQGNCIVSTDTNLYLYGSTIGGSAGAYASITSADQDLTVNVANQLHLIGGSETDAYAEIRTTGQGKIVVGNIMAPTEIKLAGGSGGGITHAVIATNANTDIFATATSYTLLGGDGPSSNAGFYTGAGCVSSCSGNITLIAQDNFELMGGTGTLSNAEVMAKGSLNMEGAINYQLTGGSGDSSLAQLSSTLGTQLKGTHFTLVPGTSTVADGSNALIQSTGANTPVVLRSTGLVKLSGNSTVGQKSLIQTTAINSQNPITIFCHGLELNGGLAANSSAEIVTDSGSIRLLSRGNVSMTGGSANNANAWIHSTTHGAIVFATHDLNVTGGNGSTTTGIYTPIGNIIGLCTGTATYSAATSGGVALMQTDGHSLELVSENAINLSGFTLFSTPDPGQMRLVAGTDISIGANTQVLAGGTTAASHLTLVVDERHPEQPGPGQFILNPNATLTAGSLTTPVRIFTARRDQNTIGTTINTQPFVAGPIFVDSNTERWGTYFPNSFYGGTGFTLFYKENGTPNPLSQDLTSALLKAAFVSAEGFFDWDALNRYAFDDTFYFSTFNVLIEGCDENSPSAWTSCDMLTDKGLSIRRRQLWREQNLH